MDWIKKNFEKFSLLVLSLALLGVSGYLAYAAHNFLATFDDLKRPVPENNKPIPLERKSIDAAQAALEKPASWSFNSDNEGILFVSRPMILNPQGVLSEPDTSGTYYPPVPNKWILDHQLDLLDRDVINEDPDGDGFSNLDEFKAGTDPNDKNSHPAYTTKLFLEKFIQVPFRLIFKGRPDDKTYQIDTIDIHQPTQILGMGDTIEGTRFKIVDFKEKHHTDNSGIEIDDSELTIQNIDTNAKIILVVGQVGNSPDSYALFKYLWGGTTEIRVKKDGVFSLKPETDVQYKLIDISDKAAKIQNLKTNAEIIIPSL